MRKYLTLMLLVCVGCVTSMAENIQSITNSYATVVFDDGISLEESKIIAQNQLVKKSFANIYNFLGPQVESDVTDFRNYENYWFIFFDEKKPSSIPFIFMVVIDKQTGRIKFADDYNVGNKWILEAALLR